jgi:multidrug efflux system outer membrane protein
MMSRHGTIACALLLGGCSAVGPDYEGAPASTAEVSAEFEVAAQPDSTVSSATPAGAWWQLLNDSELDGLIEQATAANYDLRVAVANVEAARAGLALVSTRQVPLINARGAVREARNATAVLPIANADDRAPTTTRGVFSLDLSWEIDLFGRVRRSIEAADADLAAQSALRDQVLVAVLAQVVSSYIDLRGAQVRMAVAERNVAVQTQTLDLVAVLSAEGAATELDVARARTQLLTSQATIPSLRAAAAAALNRLTTLTGRAPGQLSDLLQSPRGLPQLPSLVAIGKPADLLRRRPDILAAERSLAAASARIGVATADLFPTVTLDGLVGVAGAPLSNLTAAGAPTFELGPTVTWNVFDREASYARIRQSDSVAAAALVRYQATVTQALEELDTAVRSWGQERARQTQLKAAQVESARASELARLRYQEGVEDFLSVLDAERNLLLIEDQLSLSEINLAQELVNIHRALGGGWDTTQAPPYQAYRADPR